MSRSDRRIVLAFPPFSSPVSPPLGVATLKSHVDAQVPGWQAKVLDLNLAYHTAMYSRPGAKTRRPTCTPCPGRA